MNSNRTTPKISKRGAKTFTEGRIRCIIKQKYLNRTGLIHIAFSVGSKERVDEITQLLQTDGYHIISGPRTTGDGYYESCVATIENNQIEFTV